MCSDKVIVIKDVSKCFRVYKKPIDRLKQWLFGFRSKYFREIWALQGVNLSISKGETVGIIGRNGSGKSTLLEIIADTNCQTSGSVEVKGRISALLELGAGFNPEFTGRENIYINAVIIGISEKEIEQRFQSIVDYSELEAYIDQPIKTYSSGMYVRLAFAVAIHMDPDILIVDEALSVGDIRFQRKCFRKFEELRKQGKTTIFVTHATDLVVNHCDRAIFIDDGKILADGKPRDVVNAYLDFLFGLGNGGLSTQSAKNCDGRPEILSVAGWQVEGDVQSYLSFDANIDNCLKRNSYNQTEYRWGNGEAKIIDYLLVQNEHGDATVFQQGQRLDIYMVVKFVNPVEAPIYGITVKTVEGVTVYGSNNRLQEVNIATPDKSGLVSVRMQMKLNLIAGDYFISLGVARDDIELDHAPLDRRYDLIHLKVDDSGRSFGIAELESQFSEVAIRVD